MEFKLPDIGEGVHEGEIVKWFVSQGQSIEADAPMVEVMTDKATVEIPSPVTGTVEALFAKEGETVEVGKVILKITEKGKAAAPKEVPLETKHKETSPSEKKSNSQATRVSETEVVEEIPFQVLATPATRKLARDLTINLKELSGSGPSGRITKEDVKLAYEGLQASTPRTSHPKAHEETQSTSVAVSRPKPTAIAVTGSVERIPLKGIRKKIAEAMSLSKHTAAHFTFVEEVDMTEVVLLRKKVLDEAKEKNIKISFLPFIIKAMISCLKEFPFFNASLDETTQEIILKHYYHIGIAVDTPNGLMVPVIKDADRKNIWELASEINSLSEKARNGKCTIDELKGSTFTLTNAGSIGGVFATPVINYPEVAILGVNSIRKRPMVVNNEIVIREMMFLAISVDHRVVDGADAARLMNRLVYFLTEPSRMVFA